MDKKITSIPEDTKPSMTSNMTEQDQDACLNNLTTTKDVKVSPANVTQTEQQSSSSSVATVDATNANTTESQPIPSVCSICNANFENFIELQVHLNVDHFCLKDGFEFKCPRTSCNKLFIDRLSLRRHVKLHYLNDQKQDTLSTDESDESLSGSSNKDSRSSTESSSEAQTSQAVAEEVSKKSIDDKYQQ